MDAITNNYKLGGMVLKQEKSILSQCLRSEVSNQGVSRVMLLVKSHLASSKFLLGLGSLWLSLVVNSLLQSLLLWSHGIFPRSVSLFLKTPVILA